MTSSAFVEPRRLTMIDLTVDQLAEQAQVDINNKQYLMARPCRFCLPPDQKFFETEYPLCCLVCKRWYLYSNDVTGLVTEPKPGSGE